MQAVAQMERMAQAEAARAKYCKPQFICQQEHTQLRSALVVHHLPIKQAVTDSVHASDRMRWQRVVVAVQEHLAIEPQQEKAGALVADLVLHQAAQVALLRLVKDLMAVQLTPARPMQAAEAEAHPQSD